jgi:hypothetical protein
MLDVVLFTCISCPQESQLEWKVQDFLISDTSIIESEIEVSQNTTNYNLENNQGWELSGTEQADIQLKRSWDNFSPQQQQTQINTEFTNNWNPKAVNQFPIPGSQQPILDSLAGFTDDSIQLVDYNFYQISQTLENNYIANNQQQIQTNTNLIDQDKQTPELPYRDPTQLRDPIPQIPETTPPPPTEEQGKQGFKTLMETTIDLNAQKYPFIVNTSDNLIIKPLEYRPAKSNVYIDYQINLTEGRQDNITLGKSFSGLNKTNISFYPENSQFFWTLENNTVVIETKGFHATSGYQGRSIVSKYQQNAQSSLRLWGVQTAWAFPPQIFDLVGEENLRFTSVAFEVNGVSDTPKSSDFPFNSDWIPGSSLILFDNPDYGTTYSPVGGGALFDNLEADNAPIFLQGFPTVNLQGLLENGKKLQAGETIPEENIKKIGLIWGEFFTGIGYSFNPIQTSQAGVKIERYPQYGPLRDEYVDNKDILTILSNPYLTNEEKNWHYLNSLWWVGFEPGAASARTTQIGNNNIQDWNRLTMSFSHNRTQLHYDPEDIKMTYTNVFSNPGFSITYTGTEQIDNNQTMTASMGLAMGSVFKLVDQNNLNSNLQIAHNKFNNLQPLSQLKTKSTSAQRRAMNSRLNNTLSEVDQYTSLYQVSGSWTFASDITPKKSTLWQLKTGLYQRGVQFFEQNVGDWSPETDPVITYVRRPNFGPLTYQGYNIPVDATRISPEPSNHSFNVYNIITNGEGISYIKQFNNFDRTVMTTVPFPDARRPADMDFGLIQMSKYRSRSITNSFYSGYVYLPSVEMSLAGSKNNINYTFSVGSWFNPDPDSAPTVNDNNSQIPGTLQEPTFGFYATGNVNWKFEKLSVSEDKKYYELTRHIPFVNGNWNSAANRLNIVSVNSGYTFAWQNPSLSFVSSLFATYTPQGVNATIPNNSQGELVFTNIGRLQINNLMKLNYSVEVDGKTFFNTRLTFPVINSQIGNFSVGAYYRNYVTALQGLTSRVQANAYGGILEYVEPITNTFLNLDLGTNGEGWEAILNLGLRWKF